LLEGKFIFVSESNQFNNPIKYAATEQGVDFLNTKMNPEMIMDYVKKMDNPDGMLKLVQTILL
jgi:hypothetical protein